MIEKIIFLYKYKKIKLKKNEKNDIYKKIFLPFNLCLKYFQRY